MHTEVLQLAQGHTAGTSQRWNMRLFYHILFLKASILKINQLCSSGLSRLFLRKQHSGLILSNSTPKAHRIFRVGQPIIWWSRSISRLVGREAILHAPPLISSWHLFPSVFLDIQARCQLSVWKHIESQMYQDAKCMCNIGPYVNVPVNSWGRGLHCQHCLAGRL